MVESSKSEVQTQMPGMCVLRKRVILVRDPVADFHKLFQTPSCPTALPRQETLAIPSHAGPPPLQISIPLSSPCCLAPEACSSHSGLPGTSGTRGPILCTKQFTRCSQLRIGHQGSENAQFYLHVPPPNQRIIMYPSGQYTGAWLCIDCIDWALTTG